MTQRFADLRKIPREPALRLLALGNAKLGVDPGLPAAADVSAMLAVLDAQAARVDMLRLLSVALPARECIWWGCLAAGDLIGDAPPPPPLVAARAWVFKPTEANRDAARRAVETADIDDDTTLCANAVMMCDGKLGSGDLARHDAPAGALGTFIFAINAASYARAPDAAFNTRGDLLIDRALDIARGGNGQAGDAATTQGISA